jgi:hypothetical protein
MCHQCRPGADKEPAMANVMPGDYINMLITRGDVI